MYNTKILKDSIGPAGIRLITWELTYPRFVHAELMTHRVFSRNSASSRAIPVATMLKNIRENPVLPKFWGKNQKGMQASEELSLSDREKAIRTWLIGRDNACNMAEHLAIDLDVHKQIANRVIEPWMFITIIMSTTDHNNWFRLRHHKDAQPEMAWVAKDMLPKFKASVPEVLQPGEWHLPMLDDRKELIADGFRLEELKAISAGRIARVSYLTHEGIRNPEKDIELGMRLGTQNPPHMSPLEHVAMALTPTQWSSEVSKELARAGMRGQLFNPMRLGNFVGWKQFRKEFENESGFDYDIEELS